MSTNPNGKIEIIRSTMQQRRDRGWGLGLGTYKVADVVVNDVVEEELVVCVSETVVVATDLVEDDLCDVRCIRDCA